MVIRAGAEYFFHPKKKGGMIGERIRKNSLSFLGGMKMLPNYVLRGKYFFFKKEQRVVLSNTFKFLFGIFWKKKTQKAIPIIIRFF